MKILLNEKIINLPEENMTVADLIKFKIIPLQGTAIAIEDKLIRKDKWDITPLNELSRVTVITAAYGG